MTSRSESRRNLAESRLDRPPGALLDLPTTEYSKMSVRAAFVPKSYDLKAMKLDLKPVDEGSQPSIGKRTNPSKAVGLKFFSLKGMTRVVWLWESSLCLCQSSE